MTKIIKGVFLLILLTVIVEARAQKAQDTMVGKVFVAQATFQSASVQGGGYAGVTKFSLKDINTGTPLVVNRGSEWKCIKIKGSDYILSNSDNTISVSNNHPIGMERYWLIRTNPLMATGQLTIYAFTDKSIITAKRRKDSIDSWKLAAQIDSIEKNRLPNLIKKYGEVYAEKIYHNQVDTGFTEEMIEEAWGDPEQYSQSEAIVDGVSYETEIYDRQNDTSVKTVLYFREGRLTEMHEIQVVK